ncbi:MAG: hypothetical protein F4Y22_01195 [Gammaproteobacteria bacterium]|nr:hypothetical protein [Gammaproteobacteria bacterium]MYH45436.1 hypothetical protein [Gammaproteobacteria bacterium]MYL14877.1 hypothetical protein [Gammaproteobacteria bacterium]
MQKQLESSRPDYYPRACMNFIGNGRHPPSLITVSRFVARLGRGWLATACLLGLALSLAGAPATAVGAAPTVTVDAATGRVVTLTFDKNLRAMTTEQLSNLKYAIYLHGAYHAGARVPSMGPDGIVISGRNLTLYFQYSAAKILSGRPITVSYNANLASKINARLMDTNGLAVANFTTSPVTRTTSSGGSPSGSGDGLIQPRELSIEETPDIGETEYRKGDHTVTVRREPGTPAVRFAVPGLLTEDTTITVAPVAGDVPLEPGAFVFGPPVERIVVDITVNPIPADGLMLCLPLTPALLEAAADRPLTLLYYADGEWAEVPNAALDSGESLLCVTVTEFPPFAVGYRAPPDAPVDGTASLSHLFPLFADGDGFRSRLFLTNVSGADNRCALELHGLGLDAVAFGQHPALTASTTGIDVDLDETGATVTLTTAGAGKLSVGYAKLACEQPAVARILLVQEVSGAPAALTNLESVKAIHTFQFPVLPRLGRLGLALANDNALEAACAVEVTTAEGMSAGGGDFAVPAQSAAVGFLDELVPMEDGATDSAVRVTCDRAVAALGVPLHGGDFAALAAVDFNTAESAESDPADSTSRSHRILPLVQDGAGFQSNLLVTNLSDTANACTMHFDLPGVPSAKFQSTADVTWDDSRRAVLELAGPGSQILLSSLDRSIFVSFGHAVMDCDAPADVRNLLTVRTSDGPAGIASIAPVQSAREVWFPVAPRLESLALVLTNAAEADASCEATLKLTGREETLTADSPVQIEGKSTAIRFLVDLFELPGDFAGGEAALLCDREIMAVFLPATPGAAFTAMPPVVF